MEDQIDTLLLVTTRIPDWLFVEVSSRINGLDGKTAIIQEAINQSDLMPDDIKKLIEAIGIFGEFKKNRDTMIHARIINASLRVGRGAKQRGKSPFEILLSDTALNAFYDHIIALQMELSSGGKLFNSTVALKHCAVDDPNKSHFEEEIRVHRAQFLENRRCRLALKPLPKFPDENELREAAKNSRETQILMRMGYPHPHEAMMRQVRAAWDGDDAWNWQHLRNNALLDTYYPPGEPPKSDDKKDK